MPLVKVTLTKCPTRTGLEITLEVNRCHFLLECQVGFELPRTVLRRMSIDVGLISPFLEGRVTGKRTDSPTVSEWLERWIRTEKGAVGVRTMTRYEQIVRDFLKAIGDQAKAPLEGLLTDTILAFKDRWLSGGRSPRTVNQTIKILKRPFKIALEEGLIDRNPVAAVRPIRTKSAKKDVFSPEQIQRLLETAEGDWPGWCWLDTLRAVVWSIL